MRNAVTELEEYKRRSTLEAGDGNGAGIAEDPLKSKGKMTRKVNRKFKPAALASTRHRKGIPGFGWAMKMRQAADIRPAELDYLLALARQRSLESRSKLAQIIADLFNNGASVLSERERALMCDILTKLVREVELDVRARLAEQLAENQNVPPHIMKELACDDILVAKPVLMRSDLLRDSDLIEIVHQRTTEHQLAIARRRKISAAVSDALVESGSDDVVRTLLENAGAEISQVTMEYLVEQSKRVDSFQEPLVRRHDLPNALAKRLYLWVGAALRQHLVDGYGLDPSTLDSMVEECALEGAKEMAKVRHAEKGSNAARKLAREMREKGHLNAEVLLKVLRQGEIQLFEGMLSEWSGIPASALKRLVYQSGGQPLAILCKALGIDKPTFTSIFLLSRVGRRDEQIVDPGELAGVLKLFDQAASVTAQSLVARWRSDPDYIAAVDRIEETKSLAVAS